MTSSDFPDEVPVADAVEQTRPVVEPGDAPPADDLETAGPAPLESDASDWQEQQEVVEDFGEDEFR